MSRTYSVTYEVQYTVNTEIEAEDYDDLNDKLEALQNGDDIDTWDLDYPDHVYLNHVKCEEDGKRYRAGDKDGSFEEDIEEEEEETEEDSEEKPVEETK